MSHRDGPDTRTSADRLRAARDARFVGRRAERASFAAALRGGVDAPTALFFHGPGGIGKSTLLDRLADDAADAGRPIVRVDGRAIDPSPAAFAAEAGAALTLERAVLLIDAFERADRLEGWLRVTFLPQLPNGAVVVIASRRPPEPGWRTDPAWAEALRVIALRNLDLTDAALLLEARGVSLAQRDAVLAFAGGQPLALSLAAEAVTGHGVLPLEQQPPELAVLSRTEFDAAVRAALRAWRRPDELAASPLAHSRLVSKAVAGVEGPRSGARSDPAAEPSGGASGQAAEPSGGGHLDSVAALRRLINATVDRMADDPRTAPLQQVLVATFFKGVPTQEAAAERLGLPFSTYRRHLARALERLSDRLWQIELG